MPGMSDQGTGGNMGGMSMTRPARPLTALIALTAGIVFTVLWLAVMMTQKGHALRQIFGGLALLAFIYAGTSFAVWKYKKPGQMGVIEAQAMDMTAMKPPVAAAPVETEVLKPGPFQPAVTYTGTVVAYSDEDVYPRVVGTIIEMPVYPGDSVKPGQLIARLDSVELSAREREALMAQEKALAQRRVALAQISVSQSSRDQARAEAQRTGGELKAAESGLTGAEAEVAAAGHERRQAEHDLAAMQADLRAVQSEQRAASSELDGARSAVSTAEAEVTSAEADAEYWRQEIKREKALVDQDAISVDEYQREQAQLKTAEAKVAQAKATVKERQAAVAAAQAKVARSEANVTTAQEKIQASAAAVERAKSGVDKAQAGAATARAQVEQAKAQTVGAQAAVAEKAADVKASQAGEKAAHAEARQMAAGATAARTVRGYTEIRATIAGRVTQRLVSPGVLVSPGTPILRIAQMNKVRLQAYVSQHDVGQINAGDPVRVWLAGVGAVSTATGPRGAGVSPAIETKVTSIFPSVDPKARTAIVEAVTPNADQRLFPGQAITMEIAAGQPAEALTVPAAAVVERAAAATGPQGENRPAVWVVQTAQTTGKATYYCTMHPEVTSDKPGTCPKCRMPLVPRQTGGDKTAHLVFVQVGRTSGQRVEIVSGLKEGDEVIVVGQEYLREGQTVAPTH
jgi:RND family efflux transporter MFP subunit